MLATTICPLKSFSQPTRSRKIVLDIWIKFIKTKKRKIFGRVLYGFFLSIKNPTIAIAIIMAIIPAANNVIRSVVLTAAV